MDVADVRVDTYLQSFARDYGHNPPEAFIANTVAPIKSCASSGYTYKIYGTEVLDSEISHLKAAKGGTNEIGYDITEGSGKIKTKALKVFVSDEEIKEARDPVKPMEDAVAFVTRRLMLLDEIELVTLMAATSYGATPANDWDHADGTPIKDIKTGILSVKAECGRKGTHLIAGDHVFEELSNAPGILDYVKYASVPDALAATGEALTASKRLGLEFLPGEAMKDTADPGAASSLGRVLGDDAYLVRTAVNDRECPWAIQPEASGYVVTKWRDEDVGGWWVKVSYKRTFKEVTANAIYKFTDVT